MRACASPSGPTRGCMSSTGRTRRANRRRSPPSARCCSACRNERPTRSAFPARIADRRRDRGGATAARLAFRRRKGRKNTLLDESGRPLPDEALAPFLGASEPGGLSSLVRPRRRALREGGEAMLQRRRRRRREAAGGGVGPARTQRTAPIARRRSRRRFRAERKASHRRFYQALERFNAARTAIREKEVASATWMKLNDDDRRARREARTDPRRASGRATIERSRLNRLKRTAPLLARDRGRRGGARLILRPARICARRDGAACARRSTRRGAAGRDAERARAEEKRLARGAGADRG